MFRKDKTIICVCFYYRKYGTYVRVFLFLMAYDAYIRDERFSHNFSYIYALINLNFYVKVYPFTTSSKIAVKLFFRI